MASKCCYFNSTFTLVILDCTEMWHLFSEFAHESHRQCFRECLCFQSEEWQEKEVLDTFVRQACTLLCLLMFLLDNSTSFHLQQVEPVFFSLLKGFLHHLWSINEFHVY